MGCSSETKRKERKLEKINSNIGLNNIKNEYVL